MNPASKRGFQCCLFFLAVLALGLFLFYPLGPCLAKDNILKDMSAKDQAAKEHHGAEQPVIVNGDNVEYATEKNEIIASGNVRVEYEGTRLNCDKLTVNTVTKETIAEGNVVIEDTKGVIHGEKVLFNFTSKRGKVLKGNFASPPFFGTADNLIMSGQDTYTGEKSTSTTCSFDHPHFLMKSREMLVVPGDKIQTEHDTLYIGNIPILFLPRCNHSLRDPFMNVIFTPGHSGDWGPFLLSAWRCNLSESVNGRVYLDYRDKLGLSEGFGANYLSPMGKGDFKLYYTDEHPKDLKPVDYSFKRYFVHWRHQWDIDPTTNFIGEYYRIVDEKRAALGSTYNVLKDYFPREYESDAQPLSYAQVHHSFERSSLDVLIQERTNSWYSETEKEPEVVYTLPDMQLGDSPFYVKDTTQAASLNQAHAVPASSLTDYSAQRFDTYNQVSLPFKAGFLEFSPFTGLRNTYYSSGVDNGSLGPRDVFYLGSGVSTKFYRMFNTPPHFLGMDVNGIRHVITPELLYTYNPEPTISSSLIKQFDAIDAIAANNSLDFTLSNKFQTKRNGQSVDFLDLRAETGYIFHSVDPTTRVVTDHRLSDQLDLNLEFRPYSWVTLIGDSTYKWHHPGVATANADISFNLGNERTISIGERWARKQGAEVIAGSDWRIDPKWLFHVYERILVRSTADTRSGLVRQDYGFTRDLHCWLMDLTVTSEKEHGHTFWIIFRLKAFPANEIRLSQSVAVPKPGAQQQ